MELTTIFAIAAPTALLTAGAAWGAARQALNGTRERVKLIEGRVETINSEHSDHKERLARIETKIDVYIGNQPPHSM